MTLARALLIGLLVVAGCNGESTNPQVGVEGAECYPNGTCDAGLVCQAGTCVNKPPADGGVLPTDTGVDVLLTPDAASSTLKWGACNTSVWPKGYPKPSSAVECATVEVPLDHDKPDGEKIKLRVGRQKSKAFPSGKAVFNLAGGPGGGALYQSGTIPLYMPQLLDTFDLVFVDQRGTGGSGTMECSAGYPFTAAEWTACAAEYAGKDLSHYLTVDAARDLELVRKRLGYDKIYIRGGSYGTRLGLEYIRQHGDRVGAAVLDGLATPDWDMLGDMVEALDLAVAKLIKDCEKDATCTAVAPDLKADLTTWRQKLTKTPRPFYLQGNLYHEDEQLFLMLLFTLLDYTKFYYQVPGALHEAVGGDNTKWNQLLSYVFGAPVTDTKAMPAPLAFGGSSARVELVRRLHRRRTLGIRYVAPALFITVVCSEWMPNSGGLAKLKAKKAALSWAEKDILDTASACAAWNVKPVEASLRTAVSSKVKTLLLSGEIDVRTPPKLGDHALKTLKKGTHVVIPYASHSTISVPCAAQILTAFFKADGEISKVDTACVKSIAHPGW